MSRSAHATSSEKQVEPAERTIPTGPTGEHAILQLHPSRRCNLRCLHCYSKSGPNERATLPVQLLIGAVEDSAALGYDVVGISGGEPLMYPDLAALLCAAKGLGLRTTVTTNGTLANAARLDGIAGLVDVLAISLDGTPESHGLMRQDPTAFTKLDANMPAIVESGIPFGFITTLTMFNAGELDSVASYANAHGASLVQVHPLEPAGSAPGRLDGSFPDERELMFAIVEAARLSAAHAIPVQLDVTPRSVLEAQPEAFFASGPAPFTPDGGPLTPMVVEADGWVVPVSYGFPRQYALGELGPSTLSELVSAWDPGGFLTHCRDVRQALLDEHIGFFDWFDQVQSRAAPEPILSAPKRR